MDKIQEEIIEEFAVFDDWLDKYDYLISLSDSLPAIAPEHRTDQYLIQGCQSRVWIDAHYEGGKVWFTADSDAIGLSANLSPTRSNGLLAMVKQMRLYALAFDAREHEQHREPDAR